MSGASFSLKEWTDILSSEVDRWEDRKREHSRWASAGCVAIAVVLSVFIDRAGTAHLGPSPFVLVVLIWVFAYLVGRSCWMLLRPFIARGLAVLLSGRSLKDSPLRDLEKWFEWAQAELKDVFVSQITLSTVVTLALFLTGLTLPGAGPSTLPILLLVVGRVFALGVEAGWIVVTRRVFKPFLPNKEEILKNARVRYTPEEEKQQRVSYVFLAAYYVAQLSLVVVAMAPLAPFTADLTLLVLVACVAVLLLAWVLISWAAVMNSSDWLRSFRDLHIDILSGRITDLNEIAAKVAKLLEPPRGLEGAT